jgi:peptidoglycan/xylan/chitin deacetylase (PgdA/CDA1 family)
MFTITITNILGFSPKHTYGYSACNCVIFAMDDMGDYGYNNIQLAVMDYFISKNMPFMASIVVDGIGNGPDLRVTEKLKEGINKELFEIGIHGYRSNVSHSLLTKEEHKSDFIKANEKLEDLFGKRADVFLAPMNKFNLHTIEAISELNISVLSTHPYNERITTNPYKSQTLAVTNNSKLEVSRISDQRPVIYHVPFHVSFLALHNKGVFGDDLVQEALTMIDDSIAKQGFAQIRLHPEDFAQVDATSGKLVNVVDDVKFQELIKTVDSLADRKIRIASFTEIYPHYTIPFLRPLDYSFLFLMIIIVLSVTYIPFP